MSMNMRLILWMVVMACVGFLIAGKGSYLPLGVTLSGAVLGAGFGLLLALTFSRRAQRKSQPKNAEKH
jgi:membrane associated rhomboid family serine protease